MAFDKVAKELQSAIDALTKERDDIDEKITILQDTLDKLGGKKRGPGRPKGTSTRGAAKKKAPAKKKATRKKPNWSPEAKKAAAERMRKYWADRKKKEAGGKKRGSKKKS